MSHYRYFLKTNIYIKPEEISNFYQQDNHFIRKYLLNKIIQNKKKYSNKEIGIIHKIENINKINGNIISRNNYYINIWVEISLISIKPNINNYYNAKIKYIFDVGIFLHSYSDLICVFIPVDNLNKNNLFYQKDFKSYNGICCGDYLTYKITNIKFENNCFQCLAIL